ncbi:FadR/GntR family transcriptional regulator [Sutcliffiella cohnii]|nr:MULTISPECIES: GntR family transcriptional regulator [Sutcliffiella]MED4016212.1 GntR family transcriptional regulator [Sutcliffiella cohnii]WBL14093.1 GntR family transcriptional regulator [Sutcliffiella sp. NC1]
MSSPTKMYIEIVKQIRAIISQDGITAGDKIPSERELSDRLKVGRSSVREALRALELLGLIETRRGEGTYLKDFTEHHLVELLGTFILESEAKKVDLVETKFELEKTLLQLLVVKNTSSIVMEQLKDLLTSPHFTHDEFFKLVSVGTENKLLQRIWGLVSTYSQTFITNLNLNRTLYERLIYSLEQNETNEVLNIYSQIFSKFVDSNKT